MSDTDCPVCGRDFNTYRGMRVHQYAEGHDRGRSEHLRTDSYIERYKRIREEIPEKYRDAYEEITGQGKSPRGFQAAVCYIESEADIETVEDAFDVCEVPIRENTHRLIDRGVVTLAEVRENNHQNGYQKFGENRVNGESAPHTA